MIGWFYTLPLALLTLRLVVRIVWAWHQKRALERDRELLLRSIEPLMRALLEGDEVGRLPIAHSYDPALAMGRLSALLVATLYGVDPHPLRLQMLRYATLHRMLRRVHRAGGLRRAVWLRRVADLPLTHEVHHHLDNYRHDRSDAVRFAALLLVVAARPESLLRSICALRRPLTVAERAELLFQLRRGLLPIAWQPLLRSSNENLQRLGLLIVEHFSIERAEGDLYHLVATGGEHLSLEALYLLASLHLPLRRREVVVRMATLRGVERRAFLRHLSAVGYSARQVAVLLSDKERGRYERRLSSYKRRLVCG